MGRILSQPRQAVLSRFQSSVSTNKSPSIRNGTATSPTTSSQPIFRSNQRMTTNTPKSTTPLIHERRDLNISETRKRIDQLIKRRNVEKLYLEFWRICSTETLQCQRWIWGGQDLGGQRIESIYRVFNSPALPEYSSYPVNHRHEDSQIPPSKLIVQYFGKAHTGSPLPDMHQSSASVPLSSSSSSLLSRKSRNEVSKDETQEPLLFTLNFISISHARRLLQIHQYFERVLELRIGYYQRIALIVAFSSCGDMITAQKIFQQWQTSSVRDRGHIAGGKEIYSAMIRGLVGQNSQDSGRLSYFRKKDNTTGIRNQGVTQMHAALELFYDLLMRGGRPTFETYHSLIIGLACFKNDMEAAELLLDHMIITKKKPYVQVLHIMCREYVRRKDFMAAERIFGLLKEYNIRPKALTCNLMLRAIFQMSTPDTLQYLGQSANTANDNLQLDSEDPDTRALQLKRLKIQQLRDYMRQNKVSPDEFTFSILFYGYGHLEDGYPDLKSVMAEMTAQHSPKIEPNLAILTSLLFAHLSHGKVRTAESILDQTLQSTHVQTNRRKQKRQSKSPFQWLKDDDDDEDEDTCNTRSKPNSKKNSNIQRPSLMVPGKGAFHALMLGYVEKGDIAGMERVIDKMIRAQQQQLKAQSQPHPTDSITNLFIPQVNLEADEYTASIMLLGYLKVQDFEKVKLIQNQIWSRPDWNSGFLFLERDQSRQELIEFVKQQSSKAVVRRSIQGRDGNDPELSPSSSLPSRTEVATLDPLDGNMNGELDDGIEIDVTTLSAKLRGLMNSTLNP
ncbi:hypothetical protein BGX27_011104 [Mortierella sp. AM989]|nr:hypothetical protein BGX27_011104 [Mortierella sp. AM989]